MYFFKRLVSQDNSIPADEKRDYCEHLGRLSRPYIAIEMDVASSNTVMAEFCCLHTGNQGLPATACPVVYICMASQSFVYIGKFDWLI